MPTESTPAAGRSPDEPTDGPHTDGARSAARPSPVARARRLAGRENAGRDATATDDAQDTVTSRPEPGPTTTPSIRSGPTSGTSTRPEPGTTWVLEDDAPGAAPPEPAKSRAGRNLPAAIAVALGLGAVIILSLFAYRPSFGVLVGLAVVYGSWELSRALQAGNIRITLVPIAVGGVALLVATWERGPDGLVVAALLTVLAIVVWRLADGAEGFARDTAASVLTLLYLPTLAGFALLLAHPDDGAARVLAFIATVVCSDTGGYATGVLFGRHPLAPVVSKAKTWEGFAGSVIACSAAGVLFMTLTFHETWWKGLLFGLAVVVTATLGDLGESMIKRDLGVKDMGSLLPGHGGLMDRLDSLLPCAAVAYLILSAFVPV